jgi:hypothetical protein
MATKARLHWFWRGMISIVAGGGLGAMAVRDCLGTPPGWFASLHQRLAKACGVGFNWANGRVIATVILLVLPPLFGAFAAYGLLNRLLGDPVVDGETHCRQCDHILRGLSEPSCPECGEAI